MNRTTALFLALAVLLAHTLAIHTGQDGGWFAPPYDQAHVAYRLAHNFVHRGSFAWDPSQPGAESYPSVLWVALAVVAERLQLPSGTLQWIGVASALACVLVLARFSTERLAGVIAPLLFVVCGGIAAAAAHGMETAAFALLVTTSFLAFERRLRGLLAWTLALACLTRPEGQPFALALFVLELARRRRAPQRGALLPYLAPLAVSLAIVVTRKALIGQWVSPFTAALFERTGLVERWLQGLAFLQDFLVGSGWTILIPFPLWYALRGNLPGLGLRALFLALVWSAIVVASGGDALPFAQALAPMFAILMIAIQEAMTVALDSRRRAWPSVVWGAFLVALLLSGLASRFPGDFGPLPLEALQRRWMTSHTTPRFGYEQPLGRLGLAEEIEATARQRSVGLFLRDQVDPRHTVLTPWPGAMGYLSRLPVIDFLGRTSVPPGASRPRSWAGIPRVDVARALEARPAYIVPSLIRGLRAPNVVEIVDAWLSGIDIEPENKQRVQAITTLMREYELVVVPIPFGNLNLQRQVKRPFYLLRRADLDLQPALRIVVDRRRFSVEAVSLERGHEQIVDLRIQLRDAQNQLWSMRPTGGWEPNRHALARTSILLFPASNPVQLVSGFLPEEIEGVELNAVLRTPGASGERPFANASEPVQVALR
jgi:hypothetical protein